MARRKGRVVVWVIVVLLVGVFSALGAYRVLSRDLLEVDEAKLAELNQASFADKSREAGGEWPQWRGPSRDGSSPETGLLARWPEAGPKVLWTQPVGEGYSSVVVARGRAFTMYQEGPREVVVCFDAATGERRWAFSYPARFENEYGHGPRSTPAVAGEHLYTVGGTGVLHCFKAFTDNPNGELVWRKNLLDEFGAKNLKWGVSFSPLVEGRLVFVMPGGPGGNALAALDKDTGAVAWKAFDDEPSYSSPVAATLAGRRQVVFFTFWRLLGVEPQTGRLLWAFPWRGATIDLPINIATPLVIGEEYVFISSGYDKGCALVKVEKGGDGLRAVQVYKNRRLRSHFASAVRHGEALYGFDDTNLACMDLKTGQSRWKERGFDKGSLIVAEGRLIVLGERGKLALVEAAPEEYREVSSFEHTEQPATWTSPALAGGRLYVRDKTRLVCYQLR